MEPCDVLGWRALAAGAHQVVLTSGYVRLWLCAYALLLFIDQSEDESLSGTDGPSPAQLLPARSLFFFWEGGMFGGQDRRDGQEVGARRK